MLSSKFTVHSVVFLFLTLFTVVVAWVFRNPLLVYTAVFLVVTNFVLYIWAQYSVNGMKVERRHPPHVMAGREAEVEVLLENTRTTARYGTMGFDIHAKLVPGKEYTPVAFLSAPPGEKVLSSYRVTPARRGVYELGPFFLYGGDPFGFYKCWRKLRVPTELVVLPDPVPFRFRQPPSASMLAQDELETQPLAGESSEFLGVCEYVSSDPMKRVHWMSSARHGKLITKQHEMNVASSISVLLISDEAMWQGIGHNCPVEFAIRMVASLAYASCFNRFKLHYLALMGDNYESQAGNGQGFFRELSIRLARLSGRGAINWDHSGKVVLGYLPAGSSLVILTMDLGQSSRQRFRNMAARYRSVVVVTFNAESFRKMQPAERPGPRLSFGEGYLILEVFYGDDLGATLEQINEKSMVVVR